MPPNGVGERVGGYTVPVLNENEVRGAATMLLAVGIVASTLAVIHQDRDYFKLFGILFMLDMMIRVSVGHRWSPTLTVARLFVRNREPQWVGAHQKEWAWWMGLGVAMASCMSMGLLNMPELVTFALCGLCMVFLFLESAFGICVGCWLSTRFSQQQVQYCLGGTCPRPSHHAIGSTEGTSND